MSSTNRTSPDLNHKFCFPREGSLLLYKGLVKEGDRYENQKHNINNYNRERMRILELLSLLPNSNKKYQNKHKENPRHLGVFARKRRISKGYKSQDCRQIKASFTNRESKKVAAKTRAVYSYSTKKVKSKNKLRSHGQPVISCRRDKEYVWHPVKAIQNDKEPIIIRDVMKHYQSQYHKRKQRK